jgi:hypothetical protein
MNSKIAQIGDAHQQALELELVRQVVRRTYASAFSATTIVDGLPKGGWQKFLEPSLKDAA